MRQVLACALGALLWPFAASAAEWDFRVTLDGAEIGRHRFIVERDGAELRVASDARFALRVLFIDAFRYTHHAEERWRGDCLLALDANTQTNGESQAVHAFVQGSSLVVERTGVRESYEECQMTFAYWNPVILSASRLLNAQTGELMRVRVRALGGQVLSVRGRPVATQRHRIEGRDLAIDLWYADGQWVALESLLSNGRRLRYELA